MDTIAKTRKFASIFILSALLNILRKILLDEPFNIEPETKLIVTVLPKHMDEDREGWMVISQKGLEQAYGKNEPEYSTNLIKEANPDYEGK